jgi:transcriptional regulator with XRE-family HTH domain
MQSVSSAELKDLLGARGWTHQKLAEELDMDRSNVSRWTRGHPSKQHAFHIAVRHLLECEATTSTNPKKKPGRPLNDYDFALVGKQCPYRGCQRGGRQMRAEREPYDHTLLGKILPVFCDGTHAHRHPRVTRAIDRKGRLWEIGAWPHRKKLAPFEGRRVKRALARMGKQPQPTLLLQALQKCSTSLDGKPGCGAFMKYDGRWSSSNPIRRRLHVFYCSKESCKQQWNRRLFDWKGKEVPRNPPGQHMKGRHKIRLPRTATICPVPACQEPLYFPKEVFDVGGVHYSPPLIRLWCKNRAVDHSPHKRKELGLPSGSRLGYTFYYDRKRSAFVEIHTKPLKKGHPIVRCNVHGRMRVTTIHYAARVPKGLLERLGSTLPVQRARCRYGDREAWISADGKKKIWRSPRPRPGWKLRVETTQNSIGGKNEDRTSRESQHEQ